MSKATPIDAVRSAMLDVFRSPEFFQSILPHINQVMYNPEYRGMDLHGVASRVDKGTQILLQLKYRDLARTGGPLPSFEDVGFRCFSQFDEDGILLYLLSLTGMPTRRSVEICAGVGYECNTANLIVNHGYYGLLLDGNATNVEKAKLFYGTRPDTLITPPVILQTWIEAETIDALLRQHGFVGEVDVLSLDLDGIDYWVWDAIQCVDPRIVVVEYHAAWGPDEAKTVPNTKGFAYSDDKPGFCGASLAAFNSLAERKGYRLAGCNRNRLNAFFVRNGVAEDLIPRVSVASCLAYYRNRQNWEVLKDQLTKQDWQTV